MSSSVPTILRATTDTEIQQCYDVRYTVFVEEQHCSPEGERDEYDPKCSHFLALHPTTQAPLGTVRIFPKSDIGKIGRLSVLSSARGMGIAKLLMEACEKYALNELGVRRFLLHAQIDKQGFYEKLGYNVEKDEDGKIEVFDEEGIDHVKMWKNI